jgi:hypothetical protein
MVEEGDRQRCFLEADKLDFLVEMGGLRLPLWLAKFRGEDCAALAGFLAGLVIAWRSLASPGGPGRCQECPLPLFELDDLEAPLRVTSSGIWSQASFLASHRLGKSTSATPNFGYCDFECVET